MCHKWAADPNVSEGGCGSFEIPRCLIAKIRGFRVVGERRMKVGEWTRKLLVPGFIAWK